MTPTLTGQLVRIDAIDFPPEYERKASLVEDDALRRSVEKSGVQQSIIVMPAKRGRYTLVKGGRRLQIAQAKGDKTVPVIVNSPPEGEDPHQWRNRLRFILTQARQDLLPSQRAHFIEELLRTIKVPEKDPESGKVTERPIRRKEIAAMVGIDAGSITNWLAISKYAPPIVEAINQGTITLHHARAFDGMKPAGQIKVWNELRDKFATRSGGKMHRLVRRLYNPLNHPRLYVAPAKTAEKLKRRASKRQRLIKARTPLSADEKQQLMADLSLQETELTEGENEIKALKRECITAAIPLRAINRNPELWEMVPVATKPEIERFLEIF